MKLCYIACDICTKFMPTRQILQGEELLEMCSWCWEDMLRKAGDEDVGNGQTD